MTPQFEKYGIVEPELSQLWQEKWAKTKFDVDVYRSSISLCLHLKLPPDGEADAETLAIVRDQSLDLSDWAGGQGYRLPLVCIIETTSPAPWCRAAGNQEWLQGRFSLQVARGSDEAESLLKMFLFEEMENIEALSPKTDQALASGILKKIDKMKEAKTSRHRILLKEIALAIDNAGAVSSLDKWETGIASDYTNILEDQ